MSLVTEKILLAVKVRLITGLCLLMPLATLYAITIIPPGLLIGCRVPWHSHRHRRKRLRGHAGRCSAARWRVSIAWRCRLSECRKARRESWEVGDFACGDEALHVQGAAEQQAWAHARKTGASQGPGGMPGYSYFTNEGIVAIQVHLTEQAWKGYEAQSVCKTK